MSAERAAREVVIFAAQALGPAGLGVNRSGNVSVRQGDGFLITPTGVAYDRLSPEAIVFLGLDGARRRGERFSELAGNHFAQVRELVGRESDSNGGECAIAHGDVILEHAGHGRHDNAAAGDGAALKPAKHGVVQG